MISGVNMVAHTPAQAAASVRITQHGAERQPVVVIDNFISDPQRLIEDACARSFSAIGPYYPGIRAPAPVACLADAGDLLETVLRDVFGIQAGAAVVECNYSLVTTPPEQLQPIQCLPHFDSTDPGRIALLHYLCRPEQGGTRFFRHKQTGFETITADRFEDYRNALHHEASRGGLPPPQYFGSESDEFEEIALHEPAFNRAIIYRGITLHSGAIPREFEYSQHPGKGRLTVNTFLQARK